MEEFDALLQVADRLLSPNGCPWDLKQTFLTLQPYVLEEAHEVIEAVDTDDNTKIVEELGDLLYTIVFYGKLGEKTGRFSMRDIVTAIREKLIRRHPHVFGDVTVNSIDDIAKNWEKIKAEEKKGSPASEKTPPTLPTLMKAQKAIKQLLRKGVTPESLLSKQESSEERIGRDLIMLITNAEGQDVDVESALRRALMQLS